MRRPSSSCQLPGSDRLLIVGPTHAPLPPDFGSDDEYDTSSPMPPSSHGHSHGEGSGCGGHNEGAHHSHSHSAPKSDKPAVVAEASSSKPKKAPKPSEMDMDKIRCVLGYLRSPIALTSTLQVDAQAGRTRVVRRGAAEHPVPCSAEQSLTFRRRLTHQGKPERDTAYAPILEALSTIYKDVPDADRCVCLRPLDRLLLR